MLPLSAFIAALLTTLGILSIPLIVWSYRGRKVCDHPYCRRCGFDLFGRPPTSPQCSECGAELDEDGAIRIGKWERRRWHLVIGLLLLVLSATYWVAQAIPAINHIQVTLKPTWWLLMEGRSFNTPAGQEALAELADRCKRSALDAGQARQVATILLAIQANLAAKWNGEYGNAIEQAFKDGHVTAAQWQGYCQAALPLTLNIRKIIRRGDPLPMQIVDGQTMARGSIEPSFEARFKATALQISGVGCPPPEWEQWWFFGYMGSKGSRSGDGIAKLPLNVVSQLSDGPNQVTLWLDGQVNGIRARVPLQATFNLVPADTKTVNFVTPPQHRDAMRAIFATVEVRMWRPDGIRTASGMTTPPVPAYVSMAHTRSRDLPVAVAARVTLRQGNHEWPVGLYCSHAIGLTMFLDECYPAITPGSKVDVVLKPDINAAVHSVDVTEFWGEEIIITDVVAGNTRNK